MEENQKSNSGLKIVIIVLSLLLVGSLVMMYKMSTDSKQTQTQLVSEKDKLMADLKAQKESYDKAIAENTSLSGDLEAERAKIVELMAEVEKSNGEVAQLRGFRNKYSQLKKQHDKLIAENKRLVEENASLTTQRDSTRSALDESKRLNDTLTAQNTSKDKVIEKAQKLSITNVRTKTYKKKSSGKLVETDKARRVDVIDVTFTIASNEVAIAGEKIYYVQVIDPRSNVIGEKKTESFNGQSLTYSFITKANFQNKTLDINQTINGDDFAKGNYFVNVFDNGVLVGNSSFSLR